MKKMNRLIPVKCIVAVMLWGNFFVASPQVPSIIPTPKHMTANVGHFELKSGMSVSVSQSSLHPAATYLTNRLNRATGFYFKIEESIQSDINLELKPLKDATPGAYHLVVNEKNIHITANDYNGIVSGISSLRQLFPVEIERELLFNSGVDWHVPQVTITDAPRFQYRGMHLDVARHFFDKDEILRFLDRMALYKFNKFHWHLTDNEGWRIEIKKYPRLTQDAAWRPFHYLDMFGEKKAEKEDTPEFYLPKQHTKQVGDKIVYGGYYTQDEIREVVAYATKLGIDVIPEIDMPGHFESTTTVFPNIICEHSNTSRVICVGKDESIQICKDIYAEIFDLFPYEYVHLGADEVDKEGWKKCSFCQKRIADNNLKDEKELQAWFVHTMEEYFNEHGKKLIGWEEIAEGGLSATSTVMWWLGKDSTVLDVTSHGNQVISTPNTWAYFDHKQYNADIRTVYEGSPTPRTLPAEYHHLILGGQGNIWTEFIPSEARMEYMSVSKMLCLSEICWIDGEDKDWDVFSKKIEDQLPRLDALQVNYRVPHMEADIFINNRTSDWMNIPTEEWLTDTLIVPASKRKITLEKPYPNISIRYTQDGTIPTLSSPEYTGPMEIQAPAEYVFATFRPNGTRGEFRKAVFVKEDFVSPASHVKSPLAKGIDLLRYKFEEESIKVFDSIPASDAQKIADVSVPEHLEKEKLSLSYTGYFYAPVDSVYTFVFRANGAAKFWFDGELIVDQTKRQFEWAEQGKQKALSKGYYPVKVLYSCDPAKTWNKRAIVELKTKNKEGMNVDFPKGSFFSDKY